MPFHTHTLPNGLEIIGETLPASRSVGIGFYVRTGSRDEVGAESGVSHFLEHMLFKGTPNRTALEVNLHFDRIGAKSNAYTEYETTVYYTAVLPEYLPEALDILADILRPSLRQEDFDTEKQVILEEIGMYADMPPFDASDKARRLYFGDHPLGNSILGSAESITALTRDRMQAYFDRRYAAGNILVAAAGPIDWPALVDLIGVKCGHWNPGQPGRSFLEAARPVARSHTIVKENVSQEHVMVMAPGPSVEDPTRYDADVLATIVGDDTGSRFYWELTHTGTVESSGYGIDTNQANGTLGGYFSSDPEDAVENLQTVRRILKQVQSGGVSAEEVSVAKSKIASRLVRRNERPMGRMGAIASAWINNREYDDIDAELGRYEAVTVATIRDVLDRFPIDRPTIVSYGPLASVE
jgi:predicted Zn-dependent peptidase